MSMPAFPAPDPNLTREQALNMILSSIAMEEVSLSNILTAEGEKIQYMLQNATEQNTGDVLAVNRSVTSLVEMVMQYQLILKSKMEKVLENLPAPIPPDPPPPVPPPPSDPCRIYQYEPCACFSLLPGMYPCGSALQWHMGSNCAPKSRIPLPHLCKSRIRLSLDFCGICSKRGTDLLQLTVSCPEEQCLCHTLGIAAGQYQTRLDAELIFQPDSASTACWASFLLCLPYGLYLRQGRLCLDRIV